MFKESISDLDKIKRMVSSSPLERVPDVRLNVRLGIVEELENGCNTIRVILRELAKTVSLNTNVSRAEFISRSKATSEGLVVSLMKTLTTLSITAVASIPAKS